MLEKMSIEKASIHTLVKALPGDALADVYPKLCQHNSVVVTDTDGHLEGIVSRNDLIGAILDHADAWRELKVSDIMTREVKYVPYHLSLAEAARLMLRADIHQLVVVGPPEGGSVARGVLTLEDVLNHAH